MANELGNPLGFFFGGDTTDPRVNQQLRQKIALAMMARESKYPRNLGEGLSAIGDAIAQRHMMQSLLQGDLTQQDQARAVLGGSTGAAPQAVAEPDATPPAVAAINRAITPATPQQPLETPLTGDEQKAGVSSGDYNVLDAQANLGFKPTPGYMQDAIAAKEPNPDMQAYYGSLSGSEAKNAQDVSPTGAAGPYQFTRGTAAQYGIPGAARLDPGASTDAVQKLTADNAATFQRINGRPPTFQELALMHQQGGTTGAQMAAGTGNAPPGNLAVNNIPSGASPQQAVSRINGFYGMPNAPAPVNQRDAIAGQLVQQQGGPAPSPPATGPDQRLALATPDGVTGLRAAPPVPPQVRAPAPPPAQVAQNAPQSRFDYVMPKPAPVPPLQPTPISPEEKNAQAMKLKYPNNQYIQQQTDATIAEESQKRAIADKAANEEYTAKQAQQRELMLKYEEQKATQARREAEGAGLTREADIAKRFGGQVPYQKFVDDMAEGRKAIQPLANTLPMYDQAKTALKDAYTGAGAEMKLDANKMLRGLGVPGDYSPSVATEILRSRMSAIAAGFVKGTVGSTNISDRDVAFVEKAYSGSIDMEPESLRRLLNIAQEAAIKTVNQHNDRLLGVANDPENDRGLRNMYRVPMQYGKDAEILKQQGQDPKIRDYFDQKYGKGHADAVLRGTPYGE